VTIDAGDEALAGPCAEAYARVIQQLSTVTPALAERLDGRLDLTGPFSGLSDLDWDARAAFSLARRALEERLGEIAPEALAPDPTLHDTMVIAAEPWIYLEWALGGKISAIAGRDVFGRAEAERREHAWRRLFG
jgi:hypothetical protein